MHKGQNIARELTQLAAACLRLGRHLAKEPATKHISSQLLRSATSAGAHYAEARGAESRRDFVHKLRIAEKEVRETRYWLEIMAESGIRQKQYLARLIDRADGLVAVLYTSIRTASRREENETK